MPIIADAFNSNNVVFDADYRPGGIADRSPYRAAASVAAGADWARTRQGHAVRFTGSGKLTYADNSSNRLAGSDATFILFGDFGKSGAVSSHFIAKADGSGTSYNIYDLANSSGFYLVGSTSSFFPVSIAQRKCIVVTLANNAKPLLYIDGVYAAIGDNAVTLPSKTAPLVIGNYYNTDRPTSKPINRITILNRALSAAEIAQLYQELMSERFPLRAYSFGSRISAPKDPPGVAALLKTDFTTRLPDGRLADLSGNGWHGTVKPGFVAGPGMCGNALMANSASRTYVDFGDVTEMNGAQKLTVVYYGQRGESNPSEIIFDKGTAANNRNEVNMSTTQVTWNLGNGGVSSYGASISNANINTPAFQAWAYDGGLANGDKVKVNLDGSKPSVSIAANFPTTLPNTAGTPFTFGRLGWLANYPPPKQSDFFAAYLGALTHEQTEYIRKQIAERCTFSLDMQRVPVSLANIVGPAEVPGTPFRLTNCTWKVSEDATGKHWLEYVSGTAYEAWVKNTQAYGTYVFDYYHAASGGYCFFISNVTSIPGSTRNAYAITASSTSLNLVKYSPSGASTTLMAAASSIAVGNWYKIAVTRTSPGVFTVWIKGGAYLDWTMIAATSGTNPATDTAYTTSSYFFFGSTAAGNKFAQPRFFQGVLTADQLREKCP